MHDSYHHSRNVVHVKDGWVGIHANGMKLIGIRHGQFSKFLKVFSQKGLFNFLHTLGHDGVDAMLQQSGGCHTGGHPRRRRRVLLGVANDQDQSPQFRPVIFRGNLFGKGILPIVRGVSLPPGHKASIQGTTGRSTPLPGNGRQLSLIRLLGSKQLGQRRHQGRITRRTRRQTGRRRKRIVRTDVNLVVGPFRVAQRLDAVDAGAEAFARRRGFVFDAIQPQSILFKTLGSRGGGDGTEIGLIQRHADGGVGRRVPFRVGLAPVFDASDVGGGGYRGQVDLVVFSF
mmetsp:Transcript_108614/g.162471  ORF Transcript_108614/g.162471 Transcript_108614/m.162471 type:complete len:286 (+) Transcript_108614:414-1271(+)